MSKNKKSRRILPAGFADDEQVPFVSAPGMAHARSEDPLRGRLMVGPGGRELVPADMRAALGVAEGDTLLGTVDNGELRLTSVAATLARAQALVSQFVPPGVSLVDELLAERRREVEREDAEDGVEPRTYRS